MPCSAQLSLFALSHTQSTWTCTLKTNRHTHPSQQTSTTVSPLIDKLEDSPSERYLAKNTYTATFNWHKKWSTSILALRVFQQISQSGPIWPFWKKLKKIFFFLRILFCIKINRLYGHSRAAQTSCERKQWHILTSKSWCSYKLLVYMSRGYRETSSFICSYVSSHQAN